MTLKFRIILTLSNKIFGNKRQEPKAGLELGIMEKDICIRAVGHSGCITVTENTRWAEVDNALVGAQRRFCERRHT